MKYQIAILFLGLLTLILPFFKNIKRDTKIKKRITSWGWVFIILSSILFIIELSFIQYKKTEKTLENKLEITYRDSVIHNQTIQINTLNDIIKIQYKLDPSLSLDSTILMLSDIQTTLDKKLTNLRQLNSYETSSSRKLTLKDLKLGLFMYEVSFEDIKNPDSLYNNIFPTDVVELGKEFEKAFIETIDSICILIKVNDKEGKKIIDLTSKLKISNDLFDYRNDTNENSSMMIEWGVHSYKDIWIWIHDVPIQIIGNYDMKSIYDKICQSELVISFELIRKKKWLNKPNLYMTEAKNMITCVVLEHETNGSIKNNMHEEYYYERTNQFRRIKENKSIFIIDKENCWK